MDTTVLEQRIKDSVNDIENGPNKNEKIIKNLIEITDDLRSSKSYSRKFTPLILKEIEENSFF